MADVIITSVFSIVSALYSCCSNNRSCYLLDLKENKDALHSAMEELKATRDDVKRKVDEAENNLNEPMKRTREVARWLEDVETIEGDVVQVIQNVDQEIEGRCCGGNFPINCRSACKIGKLVNQKLGIVNDLRSKAGRLGDVAYRLPLPVVQPEPMYLPVGMESMFEKVWRSLLAEDEVRIMGLYGYGGVGKTTLLKQINNEFLKTTTTITTSNNNTATSSNNNNNNNNLHGFDVVILVVVSKVINIEVIQKKIGDRLGLSSPNTENIFNVLSKKNFVLLLDDLWERVDLLSIGIPPPSPENKKSKVVFTTRSEIVCGHMDAHKKFRVECLAWDKAWTLFQEKVGNETLNSHPDVPELAKIVAKECAGLPLALITIGRAMSSKKTVQEWNYAITTLERYASEFPGMSDEVLPLLKLSYENLGDALIKSCFLYCALFPEDHYIDKAKLIDYWIGEGLISLNEFDHIDVARNQGYYVIGILKGACLLESNGQREETHVKMHDMIRELALWIAHESGRSKKDNKMLIIKTSDLTTAERSSSSSSSSSSWYNNAERIYLIPLPHNRETPSPLKSPYLITLIYTNSFKCLLPQNFFEFTPLLRVLDLSNTNMETFPMSITDLLELRYLSLSSTYIQELPKELGKLKKLNLLDLSDLYILKKIPSGVIGSLLELRVLNLYNSGEVDLDEVCNLNNLNDLGININTQHNLNKLLSNQNLQMCTTHLILAWISNANKGIEQQHLGWSCFQNLIQIEINRCNGLKDLTWVGYVPNLKTLLVAYCEELEEIIIIVVIDDLGGNEIIKFKSLKTLTLSGLPKLKSICRNALAFPCLESLDVYNCPQLKKLPFDSGSNANNTLQRIKGGPKWRSELQWEEEENHNNNNNNNNNNELLKSKFLPYFIEYSFYD